MLSIQDLTVAYDRNVLEGLNLEVESNSIHGLLGKNGAGKTTLFRTLIGLMKARSGSISLNSEDLFSSQIGLLESEPYFYPFMKGKEYLKLLQARDQDIEFWNELFKLPLERFAQNYSTGMKKKLAFMALLIQDRPIWLLDEPFNGIDFETNEKMSHIITQFGKNKTILIASHIIAKLTQICDRISFLDHGRISDTIEKPGFETITKRLREAIQLSVEQKMGKRVS